MTATRTPPDVSVSARATIRRASAGLPYPGDMGLVRPARPAPIAWIVTKTLLYLVCFWFVFVFVLPIGVSIVEVELGIQRFPGPPVLAALLLLVFTLLGLWAALTLAVRGRGTPAPFDAPRELVTQGPYAFVRHPLVAAVTVRHDDIRRVALRRASGRGARSRATIR
jgi:protein-S-isoprenylcysteine O-methyltransferase Ste14